MTDLGVFVGVLSSSILWESIRAVARNRLKRDRITVIWSTIEVRAIARLSSGLKGPMLNLAWGSGNSLPLHSNLRCD